MKTLRLLPLLLLLPACAHYDPMKQPAKTLAYWGGLPTRGALESKIGPVPAAVLDYVNRDNEFQGYPERPKAAVLTEDFKKDLVAAVAELPVWFQEMVSEKLYGIYVVTDLGGTAYTDSVYSKEQKTPVGAFMLLDIASLQRTANDWCAWKESTPFKPEEGWATSARFEKDEHNNRAGAIQYILLHEFGHVLASAGGIHPSWTNLVLKNDPPESYPFSKMSWTVGADGKYASRFDSDFKDRKKIVYYFGDVSKKPPLSQAPEIYSELEKTSFASLYGATNPFDDFAESLATYMHAVMLRKPWEIRITHDGKTVKTLRPCWTEKRCAEKRAFLEAYLKN